MSSAALSDLHRPCDLIRHWAERIPEAPALLSGALCLSYRDLDAEVDKAAAYLAGKGIEPGDRLMLVAENDVVVPVLMLAAQRLDAWPCIVNARVAAREMEALTAIVRPRVIIFTAKGAEAASFAERLDAQLERYAPYGEIAVAGFSDVQPEPLDEHPSRRIGLILFTSGTTGLPKAVMHSHRSLMGTGAALAQVRQVRQGGRYDGGAPLSHVMAICTVMSVLYAGASLTLTGRLDIADLAVRIAAGEVTHLSFVPTVYARLLEHVKQAQIDMSGARLEYISCGGAPLDPQLKSRVEALFGVRLVNGYGMTECCPISRTHPGRDFPHDSIGYPDPGAEIRLVDEDGTDVGVGAVGEIWARAVGQMSGYYRDPVATAAALREGGWVATGDLASRTEDGEVRIVGRKKEMIIRSGFNVYPAEVEASLSEHESVGQSAVVGLKLEDGNEEVVAFVQLREGNSVGEAELIQFLRSRLAPYKCPARIHLRSQLPVGSTGKILKRILQEELAKS